MEVRQYYKEFVGALLAERYRQEVLHGEENANNSYDRWVAILGEEFGEVCNALLEEKLEDAKKELVEVAAVCFSIYQRLQLNELENE